MYFLGIVGILGFGGFVIFLSHRNTLILQSCTLFFKYSVKIISYPLT